MAESTSTTDAARWPGPDRLLAMLPPIFADCTGSRRGASGKYYAMDRPFLSGDFTYATDGRIAVRVPATAEHRAAYVPPSPPYRMPDSGAVFDKVEPGAAVPLPPAPDCGPCDCCTGSGVCECAICEVDHPCGACQATGLDLRGTAVEVGSRLFSEYYLRILRRHDATIRPGPDAKAPQRFDAGDVEGVLMTVFYA